MIICALLFLHSLPNLLTVGTLVPLKTTWQLNRLYCETLAMLVSLVSNPQSWKIQARWVLDVHLMVPLIHFWNRICTIWVWLSLSKLLNSLKEKLKKIVVPRAFEKEEEYPLILYKLYYIIHYQRISWKKKWKKEPFTVCQRSIFCPKITNSWTAWKMVNSYFCVKIDFF